MGVLKGPRQSHSGLTRILKCMTIPHPSTGMGKKIPYVRVSNLGDSRKSRKFAGNSEFPGYFEAALYHSPQDIHKAWTTPGPPLRTHSKPFRSRFFSNAEGASDHRDAILKRSKTRVQNGQKKNTYTKNGKWSGHSFFTTRTSKHFVWFCMFFVLPYPDPFHSSRLQLHTCMHICFFLNSPVTASPPHDLKLKLFGPYPTHTVAGAGPGLSI